MRRGNQPGVIGIVVSSALSQPQMSPALVEAARRNGIKLRAGAIEDAAIDHLIPGVLRAESPSWILLHGGEDDRNVLVVPYVIDMTEGPESSSPNSPISLLLETIRGDRNRRWSASDGQHNLVVAARQRRLSQWVRGFQAIHLPIPLGDMMQTAMPVAVGQQTSRVSPEVVERITELSRGIALDRQTLRESLENVAPHVADDLRESFDDRLIKRAFEMAHVIGHDPALGARPDPAAVLGPLHVLLDVESRRFLETSLIVEEAAVQSEFEDFDYAAAACPLWKTVERELNLSVGWLIRILRQVATVDSPWRPHPSRAPGDHVLVATGDEPHQRVELNDRDSIDRSLLKGLMLGAMRYLLGYGEQNGLRNEILDQPIGGEWTPERVDRFLFGRGRNSAARALARLIGLRNEHAHVKAMSRRDFDSIKKIVLGRPDDVRQSLLGRLLMLKAAIQQLVDRRGPAERHVSPPTPDHPN